MRGNIVWGLGVELWSEWSDGEIRAEVQCQDIGDLAASGEK